MPGESLIYLGVILIFLGFILIIAGILLSATPGKSKVEGGGVVIIGPIPIIFGTSTRAALIAAILGVIIMILAILWYLVTRGGGVP